MVSLALSLLSLPFSVGGLAHAENISIESISKLISKQNITSADTLLKALPASYRGSFTLMYESHGANGEDASFALPRIIFYGEDASLLIAAYGDPALQSYERLEFTQARADRFEYYTIDFAEKNIALRNRSADRACTRCHHTDPRPNWEHYRNWPGAYAGDGERLGWQDGEYDGFKEFQKTRENPTQYPRYQFLENFDFGYWEDPDLNTSAFKHNGNLTDLLAPHNARRVARLIRSIPGFSDRKAAILEILRRSQPYDSKSLDQVFKTAGLGGFELKARENYEMEPLETYLRGLGVDTSGWALNFRDAGHSFRTSEDGAFVGFLLKELDSNPADAWF